MPKVFEVNLPHGVVSWYVTSQSAQPKTFQIKNPEGGLVVETKVFSTNLSNFSSGRFTSNGGKHTVSFPDCTDVRQDNASILDGNNNTVVVTDQFAGEDGNDADYNDIFATINWYKSQG